MALVSQCKCEHPKIIRNRYTGKDVFVSCGKCLSCQRSRQAAWIAKLQKESKCHLFSYVIHLDYDESHLPKYDFSPDGESLIEVTKRLDPFYEKYPHLKKISFNDLKFDTNADYNYFVDRLNGHYTCIPHASVYDIQLFKKRLNTWIKREVTGQFGSVRSAIVSELGGSTLRPHYHGILFFDDERLKARLPELIHRAWSDEFGNSLGHSQFEPDRGKACSYIAKYIVKSADLPSFYEHRALRNIFLTSRKPPLGSLFESNSEIRKIFFDASPKRVEFEKQGDVWTPRVFPIGQNFENRLFPKCYAFDKISDNDRLAFYKLYGDGECRSFRSWQMKFFNLVFDFGGLSSSLLCPGSQDPYNFYLSLYGNNLCCYRDNDFARLIKSVTYDFDKSRCLETLYNVSKRVYYQSKVFGISVDCYVSYILRYHNYNKPHFILRNFYNTQQSVLLNFPGYEHDYFYPLSSGFDPSLAPDAQVYFKHQKFLQRKSMANKYVHVYNERKLVHRDPILYNILKSYFYVKKCNEAFEAIT